jgi:hypothetical protein
MHLADSGIRETVITFTGCGVPSRDATSRTEWR